MRSIWNDLPDLVDSDTLAHYCGVSSSTARRWFRERRLPGRKIGRRWYAVRGAILVHVCADAPPRLVVLHGEHGDETRPDHDDS